MSLKVARRVDYRRLKSSETVALQRIDADDPQWKHTICQSLSVLVPQGAPILDPAFWFPDRCGSCGKGSQAESPSFALSDATGDTVSVGTCGLDGCLTLLALLVNRWTAGVFGRTAVITVSGPLSEVVAR